MHKGILLTAAIAGATGVAIGAFGAHGLQRLTTDETLLRGFDTGARYQLIHAVALLAVAALGGPGASRFFKWSALCFGAGIILFSGSLYLLTYLKIIESDAARIAGPITPIGGLCFIAGWVFLAFAAFRKDKTRVDRN